MIAKVGDLKMPKRGIILGVVEHASNVVITLQLLKLELFVRAILVFLGHLWPGHFTGHEVVEYCCFFIFSQSVSQGDSYDIWGIQFQANLFFDHVVNHAVTLKVDCNFITFVSYHRFTNRKKSSKMTTIYSTRASRNDPFFR